MLDFSDLPKQWVISHSPLAEAPGGKLDSFAGLSLAVADAVPMLRLLDHDGEERGRMIGWVIEGESLHDIDGTLRLAEGETPEALFRRLGGRFVMVWRATDGRLLLREDSSGSLPAIHVPAAGLVGATVTLLDMLCPLEIDEEIESIFAFPAQRGFLPFGLTPRHGAHRLMPNHVLDLENFSTARAWPDAAFCTRNDPDAAEISALADEAAAILHRQMQAILSRGQSVIYLSAGRDSRTVLAAAREMTARLRAETFCDSDRDTLDAHVAARVAAVAGIPHRRVPVLAATTQDVTAWLTRSGRMMYDTVTQLGPTAAANDPGRPPIAGTGAEIMRASNWNEGDAAQPVLDLDRLLARIPMPTMPTHPAIQRAGQAWLDKLPPMDAAMALDLAKIEQIHGCWAGAEAYGHPIPYPTLHPFSGLRLNEIALTMPKRHRLENRLFHDIVNRLWPELLTVPLNRARGLSRLRFWRSELKELIPRSIKWRLKSLR